MSCREYYYKWIKLAFPRPWAWANGTAGFISICAAIIIRSNPKWESTLVDLGWQIPLVFFVGLTGWRLLAAPYWIHQKLEGENIKLKEAERASQEISLEILFDPADSTYITPEVQMRPKRFRVCVRNTSMKTAENVIAKLTRISSYPQDMGILPITLREKDVAEPYSSSFTINPQDNKFIDVLQVTRVHGQTSTKAGDLNVMIPHFDFCSADQAHLMIPTPSTLGGDVYEMSIEVTGDGTIGDRRNFILREKEGEHFMEMLPKEDSN